MRKLTMVSILRILGVIIGEVFGSNEEVELSKKNLKKNLEEFLEILDKRQGLGTFTTLKLKTRPSGLDLRVYII